MTRVKVTRIYVEMDVSKPLHHHFWLGPLGLVSSHYQEIIYKSIPVFYSWCHKQGHMESKCGFKAKSIAKENEKMAQEDIGRENGKMD